MTYKNKLDLHTHTDSSPDGENAVMYMCEAAQKNGIRAIAFTDHCETDSKDRKNTSKITSQAFFENMKARSVYRGDLNVCAGIELGQPVYDTAFAEKTVSRFKYDIVLASVHNLRGRPDFYCLDYASEDVHKLLTEYFEEELNIVKWGNFDVLAHLTYPLRYITGENHISVDLTEYSAVIDEILGGLAKSGKALEINTSGLRQSIGTFLPDTDVLMRFRALGGTLVTVGSDAHRASDVGAGIDEALTMIKDCGFDRIALFQGRDAVSIPIQ